MRKGFILLLILLFPSIIYLLFSLGEHHVEKIGSFGDFKVNELGDTSYVPVPDIVFTNQNGDVMHMDDFRGKPVVIDVIDVPCDEACGKKGVTLVNYLNEVPEREKWVVLSIGRRSEVTVEELKQLQKAHLPEMDNWYFVTAEDEMELTAFLDYVFVQPGNVATLEDLPGKDFVLLDQQGIIRAYFDSRIHKENRKLEDAIKLIMKEPFMPWKEVKK
ncbi:MAG: hypothetical protein RLP15_00725 [Cryomorphaceae bacterium]